VCRQLGPKSLGLLRPQQRKVARALASVPEWYGGLGFNPRGESLETRTALALELGLLEESVNRVDLTEAVSLRARNLINSGVRVPRPAWPWELVNPFTGEDKLVVSVASTPAEKSAVDALTDARKRLDRPDPGTVQSAIAREIGISRVKMENDMIGSMPNYVPSRPTGGDPRGPTLLELLQSKLPSSALEKPMFGNRPSDVGPPSREEPDSGVDDQFDWSPEP